MHFLDPSNIVAVHKLKEEEGHACINRFVWTWERERTKSLFCKEDKKEQKGEATMYGTHQYTGKAKTTKHYTPFNNYTTDE